MRDMYMVELYIRKVQKISIVTAILFLASSCNRDATSTSNLKCDSSPREIFLAVLSDDELHRLAGGYFRDGKNLPVVWDGAPVEKK